MIFGKHVNKFYKKYFIFIFLGLLSLIFVDFIQVLIPNLIGNLVTTFNNKELTFEQATYNFIHGSITDPNSMAFFFTSLALIGTGMFVGRFGWRICLFTTGTNVDYDLRKEMFIHSEALSVSYYKKQKIGSLMSLFNNDLFAIRNCFIDGVIMTIDGFVMAPLVITMMFINNWILTLFSLIPLILLMITCFVVEKGMTIRYESQLKAFERLSDYTQESFSGISVLKAFVKEARAMRDFAKYNRENKEANVKYLRYSIILNMLIEFLINSVYIIIIFIGCQIVFNTPSYSVGELVKFIGYLSSAIWPFMAMAQVILIRSRGKASLKIISEFLDYKPELKDVEKAKNNLTLQGDILFKNFNFNYPDDKNLVLENINLHIKKGETVGIVGKTGSGKSTLVKVLLKIYNIKDGTLFFDGVDINKISSKDLRTNIGYVAQNAFLFSDLIRNNIAFYNEEIDEDKIIQAAKFACVDKSISKFSDGYQTLIGEKGASLSGGQKQRIALARAYIKNPPILILDDSVSAVDSDTEKEILANIKKMRKNMTTFIVSSRVSVVENLDKIIVLDQGRIIGFGTNSELLETCEAYKKTYTLQALEGGN